MKPTYVAVFVVTMLFGVVLACSGASGTDIPTPGASSSSSGTSGSVGSSGTSGVVCAPCQAPPDPDCKGMGPCGCGPYVCPDGGSDAGPDGSGGCTWSKGANPCGNGKYCKTDNCNRGVCVDRGTTEVAVKDAVCGCDGVTYWNETVAAKNGMSLKGKGVCGNGDAVTCGGLVGTPCPNNARCNYRLEKKSECSISDHAGSCWMPPTDCPAISVGARAHACSSISCTDECNLVKLMTPWFADVTCPM